MAETLPRAAKPVVATPVAATPVAATAVSPKEPATAAGGGLKLAAAVPGEPAANQLFRTVMLHEGSDLHLKAGQPGMLRLRNAIQAMATKPLSQDDLEKLLYPILSEKHRATLDEMGGADFAHIVATTSAASASTSSASVANSPSWPAGFRPASRRSKSSGCRNRSKRFATMTKAW